MLNCNYYNEIKNELINNEIYKRVKDYSKNRNELSVYYNVGKLLSEAGKHYGEGIIKEYSRKLTIEIGSGYGISNLKRMRQFYLIVEKGVALPHQDVYKRQDLDNSEILSSEFSHQKLVSSLRITINELQTSFDKLEAIGLIKAFIKEGNVNNYIYEIFSPVSASEDVYKRQS